MARVLQLMKKNDGKNFESLTKNVFDLLVKNENYTTVEQDVTIQSEDGPLQFDVVIRSKVGSLDLLTVIECRDYPKKNLDRTHVDGLHSKMLDAKANKAVLVARKGFSGGAKKKAKRLGITLCTAHDMEGGLENVGLNIPVIVYSIETIEVEMGMKIHMEAGMTINERVHSDMSLDGKPINDVFNNALKSGEIPIEPLNEQRKWRPKIEDRANTFTTDGTEVSVEEIEVVYVLVGSYYFGYVNELPNTIALNNLTQEEVNIFFQSDDIMDYKNNLAIYRDASKLPAINCVPLAVIKSPKLVFSVDGLQEARINYAGQA